MVSGRHKLAGNVPLSFHRMKNARQRKVPVDQHEVFHVKRRDRHLMGDRQGREQKIVSDLFLLLLRAW
ncbi:hypothetical protein L907_25345 [Agrobacterium sp. C13]|nr:hypothetical protein L907_25345 [Agrobacterium sp. C13]